MHYFFANTVSLSPILLFCEYYYCAVIGYYSFLA